MSMSRESQGAGYFFLWSQRFEAVTRGKADLRLCFDFFRFPS